MNIGISIISTSQIGSITKRLRERSISPEPGDEQLRIQSFLQVSIKATRQLALKEDIKRLEEQIISFKHEILAERYLPAHQEMSNIFQLLENLDSEGLDLDFYNSGLSLYNTMKDKDLPELTKPLLKIYQNLLDLLNKLIIARQNLDDLTI